MGLQELLWLCQCRAGNTLTFLSLRGKVPGNEGEGINTPKSFTLAIRDAIPNPDNLDFKNPFNLSFAIANDEQL